MPQGLRGAARREGEVDGSSCGCAAWREDGCPDQATDARHGSVHSRLPKIPVGDSAGKAKTGRVAAL